MPEEKPETPPTEPTPGEPADSTTVLETAPAILNPDGTFADKWRDSLPEDLRGEKSLEVIKTLPDLVKRTVNAERLVGRSKIPIPTEKSNPEEWAAYWDAGGRPKTPDDYKFDVPEDLKELFPDERLAAMRKLAYAGGASQKLFQTYMQAEVEQSLSLLKAQDELEEQQKREAEETLRKEFGGAYDERLQVAKRLVAEALPGEENRMAFLEKYGNDPTFIRFASVVGARLVEHKALIADLTKDTPREALAKVDELRATPGYLNVGSDMPKEQREAITAQIRELMKQAYPETAGR